MGSPMSRLALASFAFGVLALSPHPASAASAFVTDVRALGPLIEATLSVDGKTRYLLFPAAGACASLLRPNRTLDWQDRGPFGSAHGEAGECVATGTTDLEGRRDSRPRGGGPPLQRKTARYEELARDEDVVLVRGRFPLAARVGFAASFDLYALLPNRPPCAAALAAGEAFMEFRQAGRQPFRLGSDPGCVIAGFAAPSGP